MHAAEEVVHKASSLLGGVHSLPHYRNPCMPRCACLACSVRIHLQPVVPSDERAQRQGSAT